MKTSTTIATAACAAALLAPAVPAAAADVAAQDGSDTVVATGSCTAGSTWDLTAVARFRKIGVQFHIDSATAGQRWLMVGAHNRRLYGIGVRKTNPVGDITVVRRLNNFKGVDTIRVWAKNRATKEVCRARLSF